MDALPPIVPSDSQRRDAQSVPAARRASRSRWLLAGMLGIAGGFVLVGSLPQIVTLGIMTSAPVMQLVLHAVFGAAFLIVGLLHAPGRPSMRIVGIVIVLAFAVIGTVLLAIRVQPGGGGLPGPVGALMATPEAWITFGGAAGWLLASGARPLAWLTLLAALLVAPIKLVLVMQGVESAVATPVVEVVMVAVALGVLIASWPRGSRPRRRALESPAPQQWGPVQPG